MKQSSCEGADYCSERLCREMANYGKDWWWCLYRANVGDVKKRCLVADRLTREKKVEQNLR